MAGVFILGEEKVRPGGYFNIQNNDNEDSSTNIINGVTAVIFRSNYGPLGKAVVLSKDDGYASTYGTDGRTDAIQQAFAGGAKTIIAVRVGTGGSTSNVTLKDADGEDVITLSTKEPGEKSFAVTIREKITDSSVKECIIYSGTTEFEKVSFAAGEGEAVALKEAFASSDNFIVEIAEGKETAVLELVAQSAFKGGTDPEITVDDYSNALELVEPYIFNTICVDTEDPTVHALLYTFINRIFEEGSMTQAVVAESSDVDLETRMQRAAAYNDEKMNYVLNAKIDSGGTTLEGYQVAARIAGMIGAVSSNVSLTHSVINGFTETLERLKPSQITLAETMGCIVLTMNTKDQVWIDSAINTLVNLPEDRDRGWTKIRRVKTRFELIRRCNEVTDDLAGTVDNDSNGRKTIVAQLLAVCQQMESESKIVSYNVVESTKYSADGDSAWFDMDIVDKDSAEHIYNTFGFQFSTVVE